MEQEGIREYRRNSQASLKARKELHARDQREKTLSDRGAIEAARLTNQNKRNDEKAATAAEIAESRSKSGTLKAKQALEFEEKRRAQRAVREEKIEAAKEKRRFQTEQAAAVQKESTLRSYGGLMHMPGTTPGIPRSPRTSSPRASSPRAGRRSSGSPQPTSSRTSSPRPRKGASPRKAFF